MNFCFSGLETSPTSASVRPRKRHQPHVVLSAQNIAKAKRSARERAWLAALWARGGLTITSPTVVLAAHAFDVSVPMINDALDDLDGIKITPAHDGIWEMMTPAEKVDFASAHLIELGRLLDQATEA